MIGRLQKFDYKRSPYNRVSQDWVCGRGCEGKPCGLGPSPKGQCRTTHECEPVKDPNGRWQCTRSVLQGGACSGGPLPDGTCCTAIPPCRPVRTLRAKRRLVSRWSAAVIIALIALVLSSKDLSDQIINPGDLTFSHAQLSDDCSSCHAASDEAPSHWPRLALFGPTGHTSDQKCQTCHAFGPAATAPHSLDQTTLTSLTEREMSRPGAPIAGGDIFLRVARHVTGNDPAKPQDAPACSTCHEEHQGVRADIATLSDDQCMTCHVNAFESFASGHPDFGSYPYTRRTRIDFDHVSHIAKHFKEDKFANLAPKQCDTCHMTDSDGRTMLATGYDKSCASCHNDQITGESRATAKGLAVFNVPGIDTRSLEDAGFGIGEWPRDADGPIAPILALLLSADPKTAMDLKALQGQDMQDLLDANAATQEAAARLVWAVKGLYSDLLVGGSSTLKDKLDAAMGHPMDGQQIATLTGAIPGDVLHNATDAWFPDLVREVATYRAQGMAPFVVATPPEKKTEAEAAPNSDMASTDQSDILGGDTPADQSDILGGDTPADQSDILGGDTPADQSDILGGDTTADQSDILGGDAAADQSDILGGDATADQSDILGDSSGSDSGSDSMFGDQDSGAITETEVKDVEMPEMPSPEQWAGTGGWYRDYTTLRYRPTGHADPFMVAWITDGAAKFSEPEAPAQVKTLFQDMSADGAVGACVKCHSIDQSGSSVTVNWLAAHPTPDTRGFTIFSHQKHFSMLDQKGCETCHSLDTAAPYGKSFDDWNPASYASNFAQMDQGVCATCHVASDAGSDCTQCHNYHVGSFPPAMPITNAMAEGK